MGQSGRIEGLVDLRTGFGEMRPPLDMQGHDEAMAKRAGRFYRFGRGEREMRGTDFPHTRRARKQLGHGRLPRAMSCGCESVYSQCLERVDATCPHCRNH